MPAVPEAVSSVVTVTTSGTRGSSKARGEIQLSLTPARQRQRSNDGDRQRPARATGRRRIPA